MPEPRRRCRAAPRIGKAGRSTRAARLLPAVAPRMCAAAPEATRGSATAKRASRARKLPTPALEEGQYYAFFRAKSTASIRQHSSAAGSPHPPLPPTTKARSAGEHGAKTGKECRRPGPLQSLQQPAKPASRARKLPTPTLEKKGSAVLWELEEGRSPGWTVELVQTPEGWATQVIQLDHSARANRVVRGVEGAVQNSVPITPQQWRHFAEKNFSAARSPQRSKNVAASAISAQGAETSVLPRQWVAMHQRFSQ